MRSDIASLATPDGQVAYEVHDIDDAPRGQEAVRARPVVICLPGMGDVRSVYAPLARRLVDGGWRVALVDLPGHGGSAAGARPSQVRIGEAAARLVDELGGPAIVVGHSYTPDSALVAAQCSEQVRGVACLAPWATTPALCPAMRALTDVVTRSPLAWGLFYRSLNKRPPATLAAHVREIRASLRRSGGTDTLRRMATGEGKDAADRRARTSCPVVVVMGDRDPDFPDPLAEAAAFAADLAAECAAQVVVAPGAGHYPHAETPDVVTEAITALATRAGIHPTGTPHA